MRPLKFRVFDKSFNRYSPIEGNLAIMEEGEIIKLDTSGHHVSMEQAGLVIEQYTGLTDKNGVEIYEGDIVRYSSGKYSEQRHIVFYQGCFWARNMKGTPQSELFLVYDDCEVIGNIHQK